MKRIALILAATTMCRGEVFEISLTDAASQRAVTARVLVRDAAGRDHVPSGAVTVPIGNDVWFTAHGHARLDVPAGKVRIRVERGLEYLPYVGEANVPGERQARILLERWVDMRARGYRSGENHMHLDVTGLPAMLAAEDLDFGNSLYWWNGPKLLMPDGEAAVRTLSFAGHPSPTSVFDAEVEYNWGAVYFNGLPRPVSLEADRARANLAYVKEAQRGGAMVSYQAGWSREVLFDALLGYVQVVNVCNNNFHRHKYQQRPQYGNLLEVEGLPEYPGTDEGMMRMNMDAYYRLLNCGLHLAAGAESAVGAKTTPAGYNRTYVKLAAGAGLPQFYEAWRSGRNFVTNGPMLFLRDSEGHEPGDSANLPKGGGTLRLTATVVSDQPLRTLEIVMNGKVVAQARIGKDGKSAEIDTRLEIREGAWIAARATAEDRLISDDELEKYREPGRLGLIVPSRLRFAHTSPIYVTVGGAGARVESSIKEARDILQAFERFTRKAAAPRYLQEVLDEMPRAKAALR